MIAGTIYQASKMMELTQAWEQKKDSGALGKKKVENLTAEERQLQTYQEQLEKQREGNKYSAIYAKMQSGQDLSPAEEQALKQRDPKCYMEYKAKQMERKAYEERLRNCKTKEEAQQLQTNHMQANLSRLKSVINNPHIPKEEKLKQAQLIQGDTTAAAKIFRTFVKSEEYKKLPTQEEIVEENRAEHAQQEEAIAEAGKVAEEQAVEDTDSMDTMKVPEAAGPEEAADIVEELVTEEKAPQKNNLEEASEELVLSDAEKVIKEMETLFVQEFKDKTKGAAIDLEV